MTTLALVSAIALSVASFALAGDLAPGASTTLHLEAKKDAYTTLTLEQGCYTVQPVAGTYTAWNPWNTAPANCTAAGTCGRGFTTGFQVRADGFTDSADRARVYSSAPFWKTAALALERAAPGNFCLSTTQAVGFRVWDSIYGDNQDGLSLKITRAGACS